MSQPQFEQITVQGTRRRGWLVPAILAAPLVEVVIWVLVARWIGFGWAVGLTLLTSLLGLVLLRVAMPRAWRRVRLGGESVAGRGAQNHNVHSAQGLARGAGDLVGNAVMTTVGSFLLVLPGFVTDLLGLVLVTPGVRTPLRRLAIGLGSARLFGIRTRMQRATGMDPLRDPNVVPGQVVDPSGTAGSPANSDAATARPPRQLRARDDRDEGPLEGTIV